MWPPHIARPDTRRVGEIRRASAAQQKPILDIEIERHFTSKVYTSGSAISGQAIVRTLQDTPFDSFDIIFAGVAATRLGSVQQYTSHSVHRFMKLCMPILQSSLPENKVFEAGKVYSIPFKFVVPHQLTLGACNHRCSNPAVREQHLRPPPTVGFWEADDQAPQMARIAYSIKATVYSGREAGCPMESYHMVKVLPSYPEDAPLDITITDERYNLSKSKTIRRNLFTKAGKLTATASQPAAVMLGSDGHTASTTIVRVSLEFEPVSAVMAPPKINSMSGKLTAVTFFGAAPADLLPNLGSRSVFTANPALSYTTTSPLFSNSVNEVAWQQHNFSGQRDSEYSIVGEDVHETDCPESRGCIGGNGKGSKKCPVRHSAMLEVPLAIPTSSRRLYLPTFYSCLVSRTYTLRLHLSVGPTNTTLSLAIPLQIGVKAVQQPLFGAHLFNFDTSRVELEDTDVNAHVQTPRVLQMPEMGSQSSSLLPRYWE